MISREDVERIKEELRPFFKPDTIAVIGASHKREAAGHIIFRNLIENRRKGLLKAEVYGINIKGGELYGYELYKSIKDVPSNVEHVIIAIPARFVPAVMRECGEKGVKVATIISGGFSEIGNVELEREVLRIAKEHGIRIIGPNGLGIYDAFSGVDTLFIPTYKETDEGMKLNMPRPPPGFISFLSQSGALGDAVLDYMWGEGIGISKFVSWGNKIDVNERDLLIYLMNDETTRVIMMYIEAFKEDAREIIETGKEVAKKKPIVVLKGGVTEAGARATYSHTASLAGNKRIYEIALREMGAVIATNIQELVDMAKALTFQPPAKGNRIGIVTNGGGPGIVMADLAEKHGLKVPPLSKSTLEDLKKCVSEGLIPEIATFSNPVDISGTGTDDSYAVATDILLSDPNIDLVIVLALHHPPALTKDLPRKLIDVIMKHDKPVIVMDMGSTEMSEWVRRQFDKNKIPTYPLPWRAIVAAKALVNYGFWLRKKRAYEDYVENYKVFISKS